MMKDKNREFQPFCLAELRGGGPKKDKKGPSVGVKGHHIQQGDLEGDLVLGC